MAEQNTEARLFSSCHPNFSCAVYKDALWSCATSPNTCFSCSRTFGSLCIIQEENRHSKQGGEERDEGRGQHSSCVGTSRPVYFLLQLVAWHRSTFQTEMTTLPHTCSVVFWGGKAVGQGEKDLVQISRTHTNAECGAHLSCWDGEGRDGMIHEALWQWIDLNWWTPGSAVSDYKVESD